MKVWIAIALDEKTKEPKSVEIFKKKEDAEQYLIQHNSFNMPVEKTVR